MKKLYLSADPDDYMVFGFNATILNIIVVTSQGDWKLTKIPDHRTKNLRWMAERLPNNWMKESESGE